MVVAAPFALLWKQPVDLTLERSFKYATMVAVDFDAVACGWCGFGFVSVWCEIYLE